MKKLYLFFYNLSMFLGFAYVLTIMSGNYLANPDVFPSECWSAVGSFFKVLHVVMYLEVVNPLLGLTKGSVPTAMIQAKKIILNSGMFFYVTFTGVRKKPFPLGVDWQ